MFYKARKIGFYALAGASLAAISGTALADVLVTQSSGAAAREYPRGTKLADNAVITLDRGDSVTVLTSSGMRRFRGRGRHRVSGPRQVASGAVRTSGSAGVARLGVSRTGETAAVDPASIRSTWQVDIAESGPVCFLPDQQLSLWRSEAGTERTVTVTRVPDGASQTVSFAADERAQSWPSGFAAVPDTEYQISYPGAIAPTRITFRPIDADSADQIAVGAALAEQGCDAQFDAFVQSAGGENSDG